MELEREKSREVGVVENMIHYDALASSQLLPTSIQGAVQGIPDEHRMWGGPF